MKNNDIEEKNSVDPTDENGDNEDSKVQQRDSARTKDSSVVDITKSDNTSKDILDITDTPDALEVIIILSQYTQKGSVIECDMDIQTSAVLQHDLSVLLHFAL
jgi:hypothetical protein